MPTNTFVLSIPTVILTKSGVVYVFIGVLFLLYGCLIVCVQYVGGDQVSHARFLVWLPSVAVRATSDAAAVPPVYVNYEYSPGGEAPVRATMDNSVRPGVTIIIRPVWQVTDVDMESSAGIKEGTAVDASVIITEFNVKSKGSPFVTEFAEGAVTPRDEV